jgi:hypothetical protein
VLATIAIVTAAWWATRTSTTRPVLIAPMIGGLDNCLFIDQPDAPRIDPRYRAGCEGPNGSAAQLVEDSLAKLEPAGMSNPTFPLGYTLFVPLLRLLEPGPDGSWTADKAAARRIARTVQSVNRPVVLYLFSDHFSTGARAEAVLARDPANFLQSADGPLPVDAYYGAPLYPWSFVRFDNGITRSREMAMRAVIDAVCELPPRAQEHVFGVTVLGETHHLFPHFETGMGYRSPYVITDYSPESRKGFERYLERQFASITQLNQKLGSDYRSFSEVEPPSKDIRTQKLTRFEEHIDSFADGVLPVEGWLFATGGDKGGKAGDPPAWVRIYRDGVQVGRVQAHLGRQDVLAAHPEFGTADVGWHLDLRFSDWQPGVHRIDVMAEREDGSLVRLASRQVSVVDRHQSTPTLVPSAKLPSFQVNDAGILAHVDQPVDGASYFYNPLVPYWDSFREQQVRDYLAHFGAIAGGSCIPANKIYSHQIVPFVNPGWDMTKFGVGSDLAVPAGMGLGVSLYGEATYGSTFLDWFSRSGRHRYGITEFHPLKAMSPEQLSALLQRHRTNGLQFLSFFLKGAGTGDQNSQGANPFVFDPANPQFGSDVLFRSMQTVLRSH